MKRPSRFLDATKIVNYHSAIFSQWELNELIEFVDFWNWLDREYPEIFAAFRDGKMIELHMRCGKE